MISKKAKENLMKSVTIQLIRESRLDNDFYFMLIISTIIATSGLVLGSASVVIGGMLLAPLLTPILTLALGIVTSEKPAFFRSLYIIAKSSVIVLGISFLVSFLVNSDNLQNPEILQRMQPSLLYMYVALFSGAGAVYSWTKPNLSAALPGVAVAVAILPPLCTVGIGLSILNKEMISGSLEIFLVNIVGIAVSSAVVFAFLGFFNAKKIEVAEIIKENNHTEEKIN